MTEPIIIFENVSKFYPQYYHISGGIKNFLFNLPKSLTSTTGSKFEALKDISFVVYEGETLGIIGRNGAGKSTTLGLIAGVLKPSKGRVVVRGRISPLLEIGAGFHPELNGRENILLNGVLMGLTRAEVLKRMGEIIEFSELEEFIHQPVRTYSSGMLARLGFSVVSCLQPEILLVDEVLAVGDLNFQKKCLDKMMGFKKRGVTMVFVSHSMKEIKRICDRVMWIDNHVITMTGRAVDVIRRYSEANMPGKENSSTLAPHPCQRVKPMQKTKPGQKGFTLIEILILVSIIGLIAALIGPNLMGRFETSREEIAKTQVEMLSSVVQAFMIDMCLYSNVKT